MASQSYLGFIYNRFPRRVSLPEQFTVNNLEELTDAVTKYRSNTRVGCSIYNYDGDASKVVLDRVVFDFDHENALEDVRKLHKACRTVTHFIVFSGKGFHFYMFTQNYNGGDYDKVQTVRNVYDHFKDTLGVVVDPSLWQNAITHMLSMPNTWNSKPSRRKFVIFISEEDLEKGYDYIKAKADNPSEDMHIYGSDFFDLNPFKATANTRAATRDAHARALDRGAPTNMEGWLAWQNQAVQVMLTNDKKCGHKARFYVVAYLKEQGFTKDAAYAIMEYFYSKLKHETGCTIWARVVKKNVIEEIYNKDIVYHFPSTKTLQVEGYI